jgi:O-antigen/teichoic acid export membrane protein
MNNWRRIIVDYIALGASGIIGQGATLFGSVWTRRILGPQLTGIWNLAQLISKYLERATLGVDAGCERLIPMLLGSNQTDKEQKTANQLIIFTAIEAVVVGTIVFAYAMVRRHHSDQKMFIAVAAAAIISVLLRIGNSYTTLLRSRQEFVRLSRVESIYAIISQVLMVVGASAAGLYGLIIGFVSGIGARLALLDAVRRARRLVTLAGRIEYGLLKDLIKFGFPISLGNQIWGLFASVDSLIVAAMLGTTTLAFYSLAWTFYRQMEIFQVNFNTILVPRVLSKIGSGNQMGEVHCDIERFLTINISVLAPLSASVLFFAVPAGIMFLLPAFEPAIPIVRLFSIALFFIPQSHLLNNALLAISGPRIYVVLAGFGALATGVFAILGASVVGRSIEYVAGGTIASYIIYSFVLMWTAGKAGILNRKRVAYYLGLPTAVSIYVFAILFALEHFLGKGVSISGMDKNSIVIKALLGFTGSIIGLSPCILYGLKQVWMMKNPQK